MKKIQGLPIINPVPSQTQVDPKSRARVRFMKTWDVFEWITGATTERAKGVRKALGWFFFTVDKERM